MSWEHPKNDGWTHVEYDFGLDPDSNERISYILNEACHVFYHHAEGVWKSSDKDNYASLLVKEFLRHPELSSRVIRSKDRVVKMVAYRALELMKE
jgi:hypothetical protein